jgi:hypothetical protein
MASILDPLLVGEPVTYVQVSSETKGHRAD